MQIKLFYLKFNKKKKEVRLIKIIFLRYYETIKNNKKDL
jgi:hypothetical protein